MWHFENPGFCSKAKLKIYFNMYTKVISLKAVASTTTVWTDVRFPDRLYKPIGERDVLIKMTSPT